MPQGALTIADELHRPRRLATGLAAFDNILPVPVNHAGAKKILFLGLGPNPAALAPLAPLAHTVLYCEAPAFEKAMPQGWAQSIPSAWQRLDPEELACAINNGLISECTVWMYRQNLRLFSAFWGPVLAAVQKARLFQANPHVNAAKASRTVILPGTAASLLTLELASAFTQLGYTPLTVPEADLPLELPRLLRDEHPCLLFCVNGRGLDADGSLFHLATACSVPTALWFVDNPWHVVSAWRQPWWKNAHLFVTDAHFVEPLKRHGAQRVTPMPLGTWMQHSQTAYSGPKLHDLVFVGRSAFPDKQRFFSGLINDAALVHLADAALATGHARPDFAWWVKQLGLTTLWPGNDVRKAGYGAEASSQTQRLLWVRAAAERGVSLFGDDGWETLLGGAPHLSDGHIEIHPPVDYYTQLPALYAAAKYSLNVTSLLLPCGLTQRHFDVWSAGGFLLTDASPGLAIFPHELTEPVTVRRPADLSGVLQQFERDPALYAELKIAWRTHLGAKHCLHTRLQALMPLSACTG